MNERTDAHSIPAPEWRQVSRSTPQRPWFSTLEVPICIQTDACIDLSLPDSALATTVIIALLSAIAATTFIIPPNLEPGSLKVNHLNVVLGRSRYDSRAKEYAFVKYDLVAGETPEIFNQPAGSDLAAC